MSSISNQLQEDLLILACFDDQHCGFIRNAVAVDLFEGIYSEIARRAFEYIDKYAKAPGHALPTILDDKLNSQSEAEQEYFASTLAFLWENSKTVNAPYAVDRITKFIRRQELKQGIIEAGNLLLDEDDESIDQAEIVLNEHLGRRAELFDVGIRFSDTERSLRFLSTKDDAESFPLGIPALDRLGLGPSRKTLHLSSAAYNVGKSWFMITQGKQALKMGYRVLHITLEMSDDAVAERYAQNLFAAARRDETYLVRKFQYDAAGDYVGRKTVKIKPTVAFTDPEAKAKLSGKISRWSRSKNLIIKEFPSGSLTINQLKAYLDNLETVQHFIPDLILLDYLDLMKLSADNFRIELSRNTVDLRGIAVSRNVAVSTVTQVNREGGGAKVIRGKHIAEDWSKNMTADTIFTINQTDEEQKLGLARIFVDKARRETKHQTVLITQNLAMGQFCADSMLMPERYDPSEPSE